MLSKTAVADMIENFEWSKHVSFLVEIIAIVFIHSCVFHESFVVNDNIDYFVG